MDKQDRRRNTRVGFETTADLQFVDREYKRCKTQDLSIKGVLVSDVPDRMVGETCRMQLLLAGATSELSLRMEAEVVRVEGADVALHFKEIDLDSFYHLKNIVYYNTSDPDVLEAEFVEQIPRREI